MPTYLVNTKERFSNGKHEVHQTYNCSHLPDSENQEDLGWHADCKAAIKEAKGRHPGWIMDGCYFCSEDCHKG